MLAEKWWYNDGTNALNSSSMTTVHNYRKGLVVLKSELRSALAEMAQDRAAGLDETVI